MNNNNKAENKLQELIKKTDKSEDSYAEEEHIDEASGKRTTKNYYGYNPGIRREKEQYYDRIESINKLNMKIVLENDNLFVNSDLKEIYHKYKKRL